MRQCLTPQSDALCEKLAVCHSRDAPRLTECMCTFMVERKMPESKQNAMATSIHTRNDRNSMAPAAAANGLRNVTRWRSTWLNHAYPLRRSPCRSPSPRRLLQSVPRRENLQDSASRWVRPIALVDAGGTTPLPLPPFCPARANTGKVTARLGTKLRRAG